MPSSAAHVKVLTKLFPEAYKPGGSAGVDNVPFAELFKPTFEQKRVSALRWRVSQQRAEVERCLQQIAAMNARLVANSLLLPAQRSAAEHEVLQLRRAAGIAESRILRLKTKLGRHGAVRKGWTGAAARTLEIMIAKEERSMRVLWQQLSRHADPWALLREDTSSLIRMGTNVAILQGYSRLFATRADEAPRLLTHTAVSVPPP